ncbi:MAG: thiamine phosphate synthase [Xanthobacteraceae bacterium]|nr:thiamine phosphate synthase [Xanthobacteraceae bacterium]
MILPDPPLLVITDRTQASTALAGIVTAVLRAGCRWISVREKDLPGAEQVALIRELRRIAREFGAALTVHGNAVLARASGADGVLLPEGSDPSAARTALGSAALVGISVHGGGRMRAFDPAQVDFAIAGPVYASASKPGYGPTLGSEGLRSLVSQARVPVLGLAGIEPSNVADVIAAGAAGIAVMGGVMRAADPGAHTRALLDALAAARAQLRAR